MTDRFSAPANVFDGFVIGKSHFAASLLQEEQEAMEQHVREDEAAQHRDEITRLHGVIQGLQVAES